MPSRTYSFDEAADKLAQYISEHSRIVFFGGAGTSTESGIPDFRSQDGVFAEQQVYPHAPEIMVSRPFYDRDPEMFYTFYRDKLIHPEAKPNVGHYVLAQLEQQGKLQAIITQNIDGLHQAAGSKEVIELHGSVHRNNCRSCRKRYPLATVLESESVIPHCPACGGVLKPDVVLYGETLDEQVIANAVRYVQHTDLLIIAGTSLSVQPAASFAQMGSQAATVIINRTSTPFDHEADAVFHHSSGHLLEAAFKRI
ncbi:NAD-dependent protein deacylase [Paenibacillus arenosi]|uniref:protein acetyllysine N-acetyltransferase n=1 Tax=Paenibacillus arenosi TaxID=2774142 RepID=A0ABR9B0G0_9BACL|nr:NAD-dependent protein deacylase [Paenibacillus arenosi]MBD8498950.1 NAD-dependent protein deacylase [Paenibacillus arenosi]